MGEIKIMEQQKEVQPIRPQDVVEAKQCQIPNEVIEAFNTLIAKYFHSDHSCFKQKEVIDEIIKNLQKGTSKEAINLRNMIFENHWLDVEDIYRKAGWHVEYDKPAYDESYEPTFDFIKKAYHD